MPAAFAANANPYADVGTEEWFYPAVEYMSGKGHMTGYSDTEFSPNDTLSRAMFVAILYRISGEKVQTAGTKFTDVPQNIWYTEAVTWAVDNGIMSGTGDTTFSPDNPVTREQMATFIDRYVRSKGLDLGDEYTMDEPDDLFDGNLWGRDPILYACEHALLFITNGKAFPITNATRRDAVVAFHNLLRQNDLSGHKRGHRNSAYP